MPKPEIAVANPVDNRPVRLTGGFAGEIHGAVIGSIGGKLFTGRKAPAATRRGGTHF
jgi:hypothetical protein